MKSDLALFKSAPQSRSEFAPEHATENFHRKKEGIAGMDPALAIEGQPSGGNDAMHVWMMFQFLGPGMENAEESDLGAEMFGIPSYLAQCFSARPEQQAVNDSLVLKRQRRQ